MTPREVYRMGDRWQGCNKDRYRFGIVLQKPTVPDILKLS